MSKEEQIDKKVSISYIDAVVRRRKLDEFRFVSPYLCESIKLVLKYRLMSQSLD